MTSRHQTAEEVEADHLAVLGPELGPLYHELCDEITWTHAKWKVYRQLYGSSSERIDLLNRVAGHAFRVIQDVLWEEALLGLARLSDPARSPGRGTRTNRSILQLPGAISDPELRAEAERLTTEAVAACGFARDWRNRRLAHRDLTLSIGSSAEPLPPASRALVEKALKALRDVVNRIQLQFWGGTTLYEDFIAHGDGEDLFHHLEIAVRADDARMARWRRGVAHPDDTDA